MERERSAAKAGFATRFRVCNAFLSRYDVRTLGGRIHRECRVPAGDVEEFNTNIVGPIEVNLEFVWTMARLAILSLIGDGPVVI